MIKKSNLLVLLVLSVVLLSGTFISLAQAADDDVPDPSAISHPPQDDSSDNSTSTPDDAQLYTIQDNRTLTDSTPAPNGASDEEHPYLVMTPHDNSDNNTVSIVVTAIILATAIGAVGVFYYHKRTKTAEN